MSTITSMSTSTRKIKASYDVVILGAGHNGLVAAAYLTRGGLSVLLLEKNDYIGGATTSQKVFPDYDAHLSRYSYLVSLFPEKIIRDPVHDVIAFCVDRPLDALLFKLVNCDEFQRLRRIRHAELLDIEGRGAGDQADFGHAPGDQRLVAGRAAA